MIDVVGMGCRSICVNHMQGLKTSRLRLWNLEGSATRMNSRKCCRTALPEERFVLFLKYNLMIIYLCSGSILLP